MTKVDISDHDAAWPSISARHAARIRAALGTRALLLEHVGSTAVPALAAKPVIDMVLVVRDSADEAAYLADLERAGYTLRIREPQWYEHRLLNADDAKINLHVFSDGCPEVERMIAFRDWLREHPDDVEVYARTKRELSQREWGSVDEYARAKTQVVQEILAKALAARADSSNPG